MQNEKQSPDPRRKKFLGPVMVIIGTLLLFMGEVVFNQASGPAAELSWMGHRLVNLSNSMVVLGCVILLVALFLSIKQSVSSAPAVMPIENQSYVSKPKKFKGLLMTGVLLLLVGIAFLNDLWVPEWERSWIGRKFGALLLLSPAMVTMGGVMLLVALFRFVRRSAPSAPVIPPRVTTRFENAYRFFIWAVVCMTIFPWWWMDILTGLSGGRPGNEGSGLGGFLIMMFLGLPALALAVFNENRLRRNQDKKK